MQPESHSWKDRLRASGLRATGPRLAVLEVLGAEAHPLTHAEIEERLCGENIDRATLYRNLNVLVDSGIARAIPRSDGVTCFELSGTANGKPDTHPHFVCNDCGTIECLPGEVMPLIAMDSRWASSMASANVQFQGTCPDCIDQRPASAGEP